MKTATLGALIFMLGTAAHADLKLAPVFGDGMVLQRETAVPVWGRATPGAKIEARFAGQNKRAVADKNGAWKLEFQPLPASSEGRELTIVGDGATRTLRDVLVGEVWLCAGQSNMEFPLRGEASAKAALAEANNPNLRLNLWKFATQYAYAAPFSDAQCKRLTAESFYENRWQPSNAQSAAEFSAIGWFFGREIQQKLGVPVGVISLAAGGSPAEAWVRRDALQNETSLRAMAQGNWLENNALDAWCRQRGHENLDKPLASPEPAPGDDLGPNHPFKPGFLWDAGMARLLPFPVRGVLWYQGESNSLAEFRVAQHEQLFPLLVRDWRAQWRREVPFYFVQLSSISPERGYQSQHWPQFRDQQRRLAENVPNCAMAVSSDLGAKFDVHPKNKRDVAARLARIARAKLYGEAIEYSGPTQQKARRDGANIKIDFAHADGLNTSDGAAPRGFEIAGEDGVFYVATARIEKQTIVLQCAEVVAPLRVRYAWQPFTDANLVNDENLPASTFEMTLR